MTDRIVIRSYQRIFTPERRIYRVEGHQIPVPGGVSLAWLGWFTATLVVVLALTAATPVLSGSLAAFGGLYAFLLGGRTVACASALAIFAGTQVLGLGLGVLDWPLRLVVVPAAVATLATQATPDGRAMFRYVHSWVALHLRPVRRSLGRRLSAHDRPRSRRVGLWVAPDHRSPRLRRGRVVGPATMVFRAPVTVSTGRGGSRKTARLAVDGLGQGDDVALEDGERLEVHR